MDDDYSISVVCDMIWTTHIGRRACRFPSRMRPGYNVSARHNDNRGHDLTVATMISNWWSCHPSCILRLSALVMPA